MADPLASSFQHLEGVASLAIVNNQLFTNYLQPLLHALIGIAGLASVFFIVWAGITYMTSSGNPEKLLTAKRTLRNALAGLVLVIAAVFLVNLLTTAYGPHEFTGGGQLPVVSEAEAQDSGQGLVGLVIQTAVGFLYDIIQSIFSPFIDALEELSARTPFMSSNETVFKLWLAGLGIANVLLVLVVALLGLQIMSATVLGFEELSLRQLLPKIIFAFLLMNSSIFVIDVLINLSNGMIEALRAAVPVGSFWEAMRATIDQSGGFSLVMLLISFVFLVLAFFLLIYYLMRLITLYLGAILAPLVIMLGLLPAFRDFALLSIKTYLSNIFVLFVHTLIFILAGSLILNLQTTSSSGTALMNLLLAIAALTTLLKTQGMLNQMHLASVGPKALRRLGGHFVSGVSHVTGALDKRSKRIETEKKREEAEKNRQKRYGRYNRYAQ